MNKTTGIQGGLDCANGRCDPAGILINVGGSVPVAGDVMKGVKYAGMGIGFVALVTKGASRADNIADFS